MEALLREEGSPSFGDAIDHEKMLFYGYRHRPDC